MSLINQASQNRIEEIKEILSRHFVDEVAIQKGFDDYFEGLGLPKRSVEFMANKKGWDAAWDAAWSAAWDAVWDAARSAARDAAWSAAWDAVWNAATLNNCVKNDDCKFCEFRRKYCEPEFLLFKNGLFTYWVLPDKVIAITRPVIRHINGRLHSEVNPAIEWPTEKYYFLYGVKFEKDLWQKIVDKTISSKEIFALQNQEQKSVAMRVYGYDKMIADMEAKVLSEKGQMINGQIYNYQVLEVDLGDDVMPARFVKVKDFSTEREYLLRVDPHQKETTDPIGALAWCAGVPKEEYKLEIET